MCIDSQIRIQVGHGYVFTEVTQFLEPPCPTYMYALQVATNVTYRHLPQECGCRQRDRRFGLQCRERGVADVAMMRRLHRRQRVAVIGAVECAKEHSNNAHDVTSS